MAAAIGVSPAFAWANALAPDFEGSAKDTQDLVSATSDEAIAEALSDAGVRIEDLLPY